MRGARGHPGQAGALQLPCSNVGLVTGKALFHVRIHEVLGRVVGEARLWGSRVHQGMLGHISPQMEGPWVTAHLVVSCGCTRLRGQREKPG